MHHPNEFSAFTLQIFRVTIFIVSLPANYFLVVMDDFVFMRVLGLWLVNAWFFCLLLPLGPWIYYYMVILNLVFYVVNIIPFYEALYDEGITSFFSDLDPKLQWFLASLVAVVIFGLLLVYPNEISMLLVRKTLASIQMNGVFENEDFYVQFVFCLIVTITILFFDSLERGSIRTPHTSTPLLNSQNSTTDYPAYLELFHGTGQAIAREIYDSGRWMIGTSEPKSVWLTSDFDYAKNHAKKSSHNIAIIKVAVDHSKLIDRGGGIFVYPAPGVVKPYENYYEVPAIKRMRVYDEYMNVLM